jgi:hypothetical protein
MNVTFTCINCRATVTEVVKHPIEIEIVRALGAACNACCRDAYAS